MKKLLKNIVPERFHPQARRSLQQLCHFGLSRQCPICGSWLRGFLRHGGEEEVLCPVCFSKAPHRLSCLYFQRNVKVFTNGGVILHIAPEPGLERRFRKWAADHRMSYRKGDIKGIGEEQLDICRLPFPDGSIDVIYCCHVLNAVREDRRAIGELFRVLATHGTALLQVPCFYRGPTSKETADTDEDRQRSFNDSSIFRVYTEADYRSRLERAGFVVEQFLADKCPSTIGKRFGLSHEGVHVCRRPEANRFAIEYPVP
jgi:SAM-dependent methyltransferase